MSGWHDHGQGRNPSTTATTIEFIPLLHHLTKQSQRYVLRGCSPLSTPFGDPVWYRSNELPYLEDLHDLSDVWCLLSISNQVYLWTSSPWAMIFPWICQSLFELTVFFSLDPFFWYVEMVSCRTIFEGSQEHEVILLLVIVIFVNWRTGTASIDQPEGLGMLACRWIGVWSSFSTCMRIWWLCLDDNHDFLHVELATSESTISIIWATRWTWGTCHEWRIYHGLK